MPRPKYTYVLHGVPGGPFAFVYDKNLVGVWRRHPAAVVLVRCEICGAKPGDPCHNDGKTFVGCHWQRRRAATQYLPKLPPPRTAVMVIVHG